MNKTLRQYVLDAICSDDEEFADDKAKIVYFFKRFRSEYGHEIPRKGERKALAEYLSGLPSTINIVFYFHDIIELGVKWGKIKHGSSGSLSFAENRFCQAWFPQIADTLQQLEKRVGKEPTQ